MTQLVLFHVGLPHGQWRETLKVPGAQLQPGSLVDRPDAGATSPVNLDSMTVQQAEQLSRWPIERDRLVEWAASAGPAGPLIAVGDATLCWTARAIAQALPEARFVVWVEHPARILARWLTTANPDADPARIAGLLRSAADALSGLAQALGSRCVLVDLEEIVARPALIESHLAERLPGSAGLALQSPASLDPLPLVLATRWVTRETGLLQAFERLHAGCVVLDTVGSDDAVAPDAAFPALDGIANYRKLALRADEADALRPRLEHASSELARSQARCADAAREHLRLQGQLRQVREDIEAATLRIQQADKSALDAATKHATSHAAALSDIEKLGQSRAQLERDKADALKAGAGFEQRIGQLEGEIERLNVQLKERRGRDGAEGSGVAALKRQAATLSQENELLLVQLHQVREELEQTYLAAQAAEMAPTVHARAASSPLHVQRIEASAERAAGPHRELTMILQGVHYGDRHWERLVVRLVEHEGRPGLVIFDPVEGHKPLMAWQAAGVENGQSFALFVPEDASSSASLARLGSTDWRFVLALAERVANHAHRADSDHAHCWRVVSERLLAGLHRLPPRFRFDGVDVQRELTAEHALRVVFRQASIHDRQIPQFSMCWWPQASGRIRLELDLPRIDEAGPGTPPVSCWTTTSRGDWSASWPVPLGDADDQQLQHVWHTMGRKDRDLLVGLLDAFPAVAKAASEQGPGASVEWPGLAEAARLPLRRAHRLIHGSRLRRIWRAARGRLAV